MGWLTRAVRSLENPRLSLNDIDDWDEAGLTNKSTSGVRVSPKRAIGLPAMWRGINLIATACRKLRPYVFQSAESGAERDKKHPAHRLLRRKANRFIKASVLRETLTYHAVLFGNGYSVVVRDRLNQPLELIPLSPFDTFPFQAGGELWYRTIVSGEQRKIPAADMLHIHGLSFDGLKGLSLLEVMCDSLGLAASSRDYASRFFSQGANTSGILMIPGHLKEEAIKQVLKDFDKIATGITRQHRVGLVQDGVKYQPTTIAAKESQLLESRQFDAREIANILGLPPHKVGDGSRTSYNSLEMESQAYLDDSIDPWLVRWEEEYEAKLLTEQEQETESRYIEFNRNALLRTDIQGRSRVYASGRQWGWLSANDCRRKENEPTLGPKGDVYLTPGNMTEAGKPPPSPAPAPAPSDEETRSRIAQACWDALQERCQRFDKIETDQILAAAKRGDGTWAEKWWPQEETRIAAALLPELRILGIAEAWPDTRCVELAARVAKYHVSRSLGPSHDLGAWIPDQLFSRLKECYGS